MSERFTAVIKIVKVDETTTRDRGVVDKQKQDTELLAVTLRSKTLEGLIKQTKGHLDLVEDHTA
ncbi:hypothetical protein SEA_WOLLYPOG_62 [Arthrobacter phage Wollypog]|uniref:Uncharacterized protein n=1 Tax=Arthrobacter phage Wollypog TaxID=2790985 RepID=A0A7T3N1I0_9CAUD|nr:hypothetical protein PP291_gp62 [Arthrobacter phage Wollypog]QPX62613.1 hypothetical protein SEA_WOLLYPOG_62 [Arthrobacter phage Wollypog]